MDDAEVQGHIDRAVRRLVTTIIRWPVVDDTTDRADDTDIQGHVIAAVGEVISARRQADLAAVEVGGNAAAEIIAAGGSVKAGSLAVSGSSNGSGGGARLGSRASVLPVEAVEALLAAGMVGGSVPTW
ncbi:MAG: hypothetical protein M3443_08090 [Actinomycetota bacterium]|nr:hypothetical protein [Actinomycetota bacterium]